ncbi:MAG: substrate-binding domain-containing protein [Alphaproteobacteria bacterium]
MAGEPPHPAEAGSVIRVFSANGVKAVMGDLAPRFAERAGIRLAVQFGEAGEVRQRVVSGEPFDLALLPAATLVDLAGLGRIDGGAIVEVARTAVGMAVRTGAAMPDVSSAEAFRRWLLGVSSIVITDPDSGGVSGVHFADVLHRLGIADALAPKFRLTRGALNAAFVAAGEAELAVQLAHEIRAVAGVDFVPMPSDFTRTITFSAGLSAAAGSAANELLGFLSGPEAASIIAARFMQPAVGT